MNTRSHSAPPFRRLVLFTAAFAAGFLSTCSNVVPKSLTLLVRTGLESEGLRKVAQSFKASTGIDVIINEEGRPTYLTAVPSQLLAGTAKADVLFLPSTMIAELAAGNAILPLDDRVDCQDPDLLAVYGYQRKTYAIPCDISTMFLYYRTDLISHPPETWEEYEELGRQFSKRSNPDSPTEYGCTFPGMAGEELPKAFYCFLWSYGGFIIRNDSVGLDTPQAIKAAEMYESFVTSGVLPPDVTSWGFSQVLENLESGKSAMAAPMWNAAYPFIVTGKSEFKDRIGIALVPGVRDADGRVRRVPFQHAWTLAVNARSVVPDLASQFIKFATSGEGAKLYARSARGNPARRSILQDESLQKERPEFNLILESLDLAQAEPDVTFYAAMHEAMNQALTQVLTGTETPSQALREASSKIRSLVN